MAPHRPMTGLGVHTRTHTSRGTASTVHINSHAICADTTEDSQLSDRCIFCYAGTFHTTPCHSQSTQRAGAGLAARCGGLCVPRNSKSGHQLIQNIQAGVLSLSPG